MSAVDHDVSRHFAIDLLMGLLLFVLLGTFVVLAQAYAETQPLLLLVMPIPIASALIVLVVVHDRRVAST